MAWSALPSTIPVFPLPNVVFFPKTYIPLHIFEPRYRQMVVDAQQGDGIIGMALLKEGWEAHYHGNPPIYPVGCAGRLVTVESLEDGRFNILLYGIGRFLVTREHFDRPYRQAQVEPLPQKRSGVLAPRELAHLLDLVKNLGKQVEQGSMLEALMEAGLEDETLIQTLSFTLPFTPLEKQFLLEAETLSQQAHRLMDLLRFLILDHATGRRSRQGH